MGRINPSNARWSIRDSVESDLPENVAESANLDPLADRFEQWRQRWNRSRHDLHDRLEALEDLLDALNDEQHATPSIFS